MFIKLVTMLAMFAIVKSQYFRQSGQLYHPVHDGRSSNFQLEDQTASAQSGDPRAVSHRGQQTPGYSGTVVEGKSAHILRYNHGVPVYGSGEPYYFSYTHNFPIATSDFENIVNSHNLPKKFKFGGGLDVTGLLEHGF